MRKIISSLILFLVVFSSKGQNVGINTNTPHPSAALDITDSTKGILIPRMTMSQRNGIQNPAEGLMVYQTDSTMGYWSFDGQSWKHLLDLNGSTQGDMLYWNGSNWVTVPAGQHGQGLFFCNGVPSWGGCTPLLTTTPISDTTTSSAVSGGNINNDGGSTIISRGIVWDTLPNPTIMLSTKTNEGTGTGVFISNMTNLNFNTTYYVRSYGTNSNGTSYGNQLTFNTKPVVLPTITTNPVFDTTSTSAKSGGNITDDGGSSITSRGIVWDTLPNPTISLSTKTNDGSGVGNFTSNLINLSPNKTYYVRAYGTNIAGTSYGQELTLTTPNIDVNTGLVAYYPFNGNANDESGNGNNGSVLTGTTLTTDRYNSANSAYQVDGINCPTPKGVSLPASITNTDYTISIWCKSNDSTKQNQCIINSYPHGYIGLNLNYGLPNTLNKMCSFYGNGPWLTNGDEINWNSFNKQDWKNFVIVKKSNALFFYENGILAFNYPISVLSNPGTINYFIAGAISINGGSECYETFKGKIDDIRVYNRALTQAEITYLATH